MINLALDETHHIQNGKALYTTRYKKVMSFHDGIAPVETNQEAFFIDTHNNKLFDRTFLKAYGFYEELSAVQDDKGCFHINSKGEDVYSQRYKWVGNFSEGKCVIRDFDNNYFHIDTKGERIYPSNYCYTGDFKYGIAVVINKEGLSTHMKADGELLHGLYFEELNIFHKGYAIAKDRDGYFHINKKAQALYAMRYKKLEDFYNGYALATTNNCQKVILNEQELTEFQLAVANIDKEQLLNDSFGYFKYQILYAILKLDILKAIDENQEITLPKISKTLIFRWLYVEKIIDNNNKLTSLGKVIEDELKPILLYWQDLPFKVSTLLSQSLMEGKESFSKLYEKPYFDFLEENKEYAILSSKINNYYSIDYCSLVPNFNLTTQTVCDIGGGSGRLIDSLKEYYPNIKTIIADKFIDKTVKNNIKIDFFKPFKVSCDVFILSRVLHDWNDEKAFVILKNIAKNMSSKSQLFILDTIVPLNSREDKGITLSLHLLNFLGGYERTVKDFERVLSQVNLKIKSIHNEDDLISLIKVVKQ